MGGIIQCFSSYLEKLTMKNVNKLYSLHRRVRNISVDSRWNLIHCPIFACIIQLYSGELIWIRETIFYRSCHFQTHLHVTRGIIDQGKA